MLIRECFQHGHDTNTPLSEAISDDRINNFIRESGTSIWFLTVTLEDFATRYSNSYGNKIKGLPGSILLSYAAYANLRTGLNFGGKVWQELLNNTASIDNKSNVDNTPNIPNVANAATDSNITYNADIANNDIALRFTRLLYDLSMHEDMDNNCMKLIDMIDSATGEFREMLELAGFIVNGKSAYEYKKYF